MVLNVLSAADKKLGLFNSYSRKYSVINIGLSGFEASFPSAGGVMTDWPGDPVKAL